MELQSTKSVPGAATEAIISADSFTEPPPPLPPILPPPLSSKFEDLVTITLSLDFSNGPIRSRMDSFSNIMI